GRRHLGLDPHVLAGVYGLACPPTSGLSPYTTLFRSPVPRSPGSRRTVCRPARRRPRRGWCVRAEPTCCATATGSSAASPSPVSRSEEHTSELQSRFELVCRLLLEKKKITDRPTMISC